MGEDDRCDLYELRDVLSREVGVGAQARYSPYPGITP
jgi:hypothetical protein